VYEILQRYDWNMNIARDQLRVMSEWSEQSGAGAQTWGDNDAKDKDDKKKPVKSRLVVTPRREGSTKER
jgi:hypothetical protein